MEGISGHHALMTWYPSHQCLGHRDLIGLIGNGNLDERLVGLVRHHRQQVRCAILVHACTAEDLAVERNRFSLSSWTGPLYPSSKRPFQVGSRELGEQPAIE